MQTGSSETLIGWKSGKITYVHLGDRMEGTWLWALYSLKHLNFRIKHTYLLNSLPLYRPPDEYPAALKVKTCRIFH